MKSATRKSKYKRLSLHHQTALVFTQWKVHPTPEGDGASHFVTCTLWYLKTRTLHARRRCHVSASSHQWPTQEPCHVTCTPEVTRPPSVAPGNKWSVSEIMSKKILQVFCQTGKREGKFKVCGYKPNSQLKQNKFLLHSLKCQRCRPLNQFTL